MCVIRGKGVAWKLMEDLVIVVLWRCSSTSTLMLHECVVPNIKKVLHIYIYR